MKISSTTKVLNSFMLLLRGILLFFLFSVYKHIPFLVMSLFVCVCIYTRFIYRCVYKFYFYFYKEKKSKAIFFHVAAVALMG